MERDRIVYLMAEMYAAGKNSILGEPTYTVTGHDERELIKEALLLTDEWSLYNGSVYDEARKVAAHYKSDAVYGQLFGMGAWHTPAADKARGAVNDFIRKVEVAEQFRDAMKSTARLLYDRWMDAMRYVGETIGEADCDIEQVDPKLMFRQH